MKTHTTDLHIVALSAYLLHIRLNIQTTCTENQSGDTPPLTVPGPLHLEPVVQCSTVLLLLV